MRTEAKPAGQVHARGNQRKRKRIVQLVALLVLAIIAALLLLRQCAPKEDTLGELERELAAELGLLPGMSDEEIQDRLNRKVAESMLNVSINPMPFFETGQAAGNLRIENIPGNRYSFVVTIVRSSDGKTLLTTGLIDPGYYVESMKLDEDLPKGEYLCVANFTAYDPEGLSQIGETGTQILITVEG